MPKVPFWVFILIAVLYFTATRVDIMDIDASQYAEISREMMKSGDYLHIYDRGMDYLDKPPFLFWASAASMKVFGVNNFGYKFPSILFALLALFATYKLAKLLYGEVTGRMAALVLATCQGMFLMTNDIRCDTILMGWVITAIWLIQEWIGNRKLLYLLAGSACIAFGMMTKGPIALMVPVFCFSADWVLKRQWQNFLKPAWLISLIIIAVLLIPMSIGLYQQFDLHPEKLIDGRYGVSGLRFFYWSQSFGRITGESPWKNDVDITFLLQNMLWSFLPWISLLIPALVINIIVAVRQKFRLQNQQEGLTTGGFLLTYLALGSSSYQLPHYIFVAYPLAAIITARLLYELVEEGKYKRFYSFMKPFQAVITSLLLLVVVVLMVYVFPAPVLVIAAWVFCFIIWFYLAFRRSLKGKLLWLPAAGLIIANIFLSNYIYPTLLQYQVGSQVGRYINEQSIPPGAVAIYKMDDALNSLPFYAQDTISGIDTLTNTKGKKYLLTMDKGLNELKQMGLAYTIEKQGPLFKVSELTPEFLNPKTRNTVAKNYYLVKLK
ncbi:MAG: ArnT family glycosyltransferase [Chitinophagales bacterium]